MNFHFCRTVQPDSELCTKAVFDSILTDAKVLETCAKIKEIVDAIQDNADEQKTKLAKKNVTALKAQLPGFCFHASFTDGKRHKESAVPSGLVSLDLDHIDNPKEFFNALKDKAVALDMALAFITPSTHGLKFVFKVPSTTKTIEEAQEQIASQLGVEAYLDGKTFDLTRLAFAVPQTYFLYRNDDVLFGDFPLPEGFEQDEAEQVTDEEAERVEVPDNEASQRFFNGIPMSDIITRICINVCNQPTPPEGQRNNTLFEVFKRMRYCCDDEQMLMHVVPTFGLDKAEWYRTMKSACARPLSKTVSDEMGLLIAQMKREKAMENGYSMVNMPELPAVLPPVFREFARVTPPELRPAMMMTLLPILGFFGTNVKANFAGKGERPDWRTPSFTTVIIAPPASGKNDITTTYKLLMGDIIEDEQELLMQLNKYNRSKKDSDLPARPIRIMPERLSMTSMSLQLQLAKGQHLMLFTPEIDTLKTSNGSGSWSDLSTVFRKAIDNDNIGQIYMSGDSHCCNVPVYLNMLLLAQPESFYSFFSKKTVENGLDTRIIPVELPDNTGCRKVSVKEMSDFEHKNVWKVIDQLKNAGTQTPEVCDDEGNVISPATIERQIISLPRCKKALERWGINHQDHYLQNQENPAEDHYFRRAKLIAFHAAMVAYMCSGMKETKAVIDFALWVAEYIFQAQMVLFAQTWNSLQQKRSEKKLDAVIALNETARFNLFDELPVEFEVEDIQRIALNYNHHIANPYKKISTWRKRDMIVEVVVSDNRKKRWRKVNA